LLYTPLPAIAGETKVNNMATLNGKTPEQLATEIVKDAVESQMIEIDGVSSQHLDVLARYENRDTIQVRGEKFWTKNRDRLREETIVNLVNGRHKGLVKYLDKREQDAANSYFQKLVKGGMAKDEAFTIAFNGVEAKTV
jgi:hypothetical protein